MKSATYALFDFDGVIADSFAIASALAQRLCIENTPEKYKSAFEGNIYDTVTKDKERRSRETHGPECDHSLDWWTEYTKAFAGSVVPFDGIVEALKRLSESHGLFVVSSGHKNFIMPFLEKNGIADIFQDVYDVDSHTHKTEKIQMIFDTHAISAAECVFVTDTLGDIREAAHHSMGAIAVTWGFHTRETLEKGVPFRIVEKPAELPDAVNEYFAQ